MNSFVPQGPRSSKVEENSFSNCNAYSPSQSDSCLLMPSFGGVAVAWAPKVNCPSTFHLNVTHTTVTPTGWGFYGRSNWGDHWALDPLRRILWSPVVCLSAAVHAATPIHWAMRCLRVCAHVCTGMPTFLICAGGRGGILTLLGVWFKLTSLGLVCWPTSCLLKMSPRPNCP